MPFAALVFWAHKIDHLGLPSIFHFFQVFIPNGLISGAPVIQIIMTYSRLTPEKLQHACLPKAGSQGLMHYGVVHGTEMGFEGSGEGAGATALTGVWLCSKN